VTEAIDQDAWAAARDNAPNPRGIAALSTMSDPEQAARAVQLSKATGAPAPVINADVEAFEKRLQAQSAGDLVANNPHLSSYVLSDPMAAKVSSDDYAKLDSASEAMQRLGKLGLFQVIARTSMAWSKAARGEQDPGLDWTSAMNELNRAADDATASKWQRAPAMVGRDIGNLLQGIAELPGRVHDAVTNPIAFDPESGEIKSRDPHLPMDLAMLLIGGNHPPGEAPPEVIKAAQSAEKIRPWVADGKVPPIGVDPLVDEIKKTESDADLDKLKEAFKQAQATETIKRSPESFKQFALLSEEVGDKTIGISGKAVAALYGDTPPHPGDGILGFVPDIETQLERARIGADVEVPAADLFAHMDPEVFKTLADDMRVRPEGFTKNEEVPPEKEEVPGADPVVQSLRRAAGLELDPNEEWFAEGYPVELGRSYRNIRNMGEDLPPWFENVKSTIADLAENLKLPKAPILWAGTARELGLGGITSSNGHIIVSDHLKPNEALNTGIHEFGHQVEFQLLRDAEPETKQAIQEAYARDSGKGKTILQTRPVTGQRYDPIAASIPASRYHTSFPEWFAEQVSRWITQNREPSGVVEKFFQGIANIWRRIYEKVTGHVALAPEVAEFMRKNWHGDLIEKARTAAPIQVTEPQEPALPGAGAPKPVGMPVTARAIDLHQRLFNKYADLINKRNEQDTNAALARAKAYEAKTQTAEWARNEKAMRESVTSEVTQEPTHIADRVIREGKKLDVDQLSDEQRAGLPKDAYTRGGWSPDSIAQISGHSTGEAMIRDVSALHAARGEVPPEEYLKNIIDTQTAARMNAEHGKLDENIIEAAKQQVLSITQLDILHAKLEEAWARMHPDAPRLPLSRTDVQQSAKRMVEDTRLADISSDKLLADGGRAMREVEKNLLDENPVEAFKARSEHFLLTAMAKEALEIEKAKVGFDKLVKTYQELPEDIKGRRGDWIDQIQRQLHDLGVELPRSIANITNSISRDGYGSLEDFVRQKLQKSGLDIPVPDYILDGSLYKSVPNLTGGEFMDIQRMFKSMDFHARNESKVWAAGEKMDKAAAQEAMLDKVKELGIEKPWEASQREAFEGPLAFGRAFWWRHQIMEKIFDRIDKWDPFGPFNKYITRPITEAIAAQEREIRTYKSQVAANFKGVGDVSRKVENDLWRAPDDPNTFMKFTREDLLGLLHHIGNASNRDKLFRGYKLNPEVGTQWIWNKLRQDPLGIEGAIKLAQANGKIFEEMWSKTDNMSRELNGYGVDKISLGKMWVPDVGFVDEWYHPLSDTNMRSRFGGKDDLFGEGFGDSVRATTNQTRSTARTQAVYPVSTKLSIVPIAMNQMIHDYSMRPAISQAAKFFYDKTFRNTMAKNFGPHQEALFIPWLRDIAGTADFKPLNEQINDRWISYFTNNLASTMIGGNIGTMSKHNLTAGLKNWAQMPLGFPQEILRIITGGEIEGKPAWEFAHDTSDEVARRGLSMEQQNARQGSRIETYRGGVTTAPLSFQAWRTSSQNLRSTLQWAGSYPLAFIDRLFSAAAFNARYQRAIGEGMSPGDAVYLGDKTVRDTHGSSAISNKAEVARSRNAVVRTFLQLFIFYSENMQAMYEIGSRSRDAYGLAKQGEWAQAGAHLPHIAMRLFTNVIIPAYVDYMVASKVVHQAQDKDSFTREAAGAIGSTISGGFFGVRDIISAAVEGRSPSSGLISEMGKDLTQPMRDLMSRKALTRETAGTLAKDMTVMFGLITGWTTVSEANILKSYIDIQNRQQRPPQTLWQAGELARFAKTEGHTKSALDWLKSGVP